MSDLNDRPSRNRSSGEGDHWGHYWAGGVLTSLPEDFRTNYDGEIQAFWNEMFARVPDRGRVLDVCTGNGAIALLAAEALGGREVPVEILAVDAAAISPEAVAQRFPDQSPLVRAVEFIPQTRFEDLDLPGGSVDLVTSQYGIEYCELEAASRQVFRLLRSGGRLAMLCHAVSSDMLRTMEVEHRDYRRLDQLQLLHHLSEFLDHALDPSAFRRALARIRVEIVSDRKRLARPLFRMALGMIEQTLSMPDEAIEQARPRYRGFAGQLQSGRDRLADMLQVNTMMRDDDDWTGVFTRAGLASVDSGRIYYQGRHDVGRYYVFEKP